MRKSREPVILTTVPVLKAKKKKRSRKLYFKKRYQERRAAVLLKLGGVCAVLGCGETRSRHLEIDHIDPSTKSFFVSRVWGAAKERFWAEIEKTQLLCSRHHRLKTAYEQSVGDGGDWLSWDRTEREPGCDDDIDDNADTAYR